MRLLLATSGAAVGDRLLLNSDRMSSTVSFRLNNGMSFAASVKTDRACSLSSHSKLSNRDFIFGLSSMYSPMHETKSSEVMALSQYFLTRSSLDERREPMRPRLTMWSFRLSASAASWNVCELMKSSRKRS